MVMVGGAPDIYIDIHIYICIMYIYIYITSMDIVFQIWWFSDIVSRISAKHLGSRPKFWQAIAKAPEALLRRCVFKKNTCYPP